MYATEATPNCALICRGQVPCAKTDVVIPFFQEFNRWTNDIEKDFSQWFNTHISELPVPKAQIQ
ncbi:MAG: hypothetical protein EAZ70_09330 [Runella slithyformis]|nr:MAG: hypothetical protein EAY79_00035 [Runella slithyformis]TAE97624.1 MAG: hypothetical protein EAZ80_07260 [Runella slithyformis]TAF25953.1 MAG: hypothetical protein EAZ70_09330 [Runella slithyformis]TAF45085.1 MAG: hypothetical protein EAZ63_11570 [Runella slithyformis]TAF80053.1 MAG: hypothetical protein EAZ50_09735 [Runella slithyformis]